MDIALGTVIFIFLLVVPNLIFRRFYFVGAFSQEYFKHTPFLSFISSIVPGFLLHVSFLYLIIKFTPEYFTKIVDLAKLFNSPYIYFFKNNTLTTDFKELLFLLFHYNIFLWIYVFIVAFISRNAIRFFKLDRRFKMLRFKNSWHYIFTGEILDFPFTLGKSKDITFIHIDVLVNSGSQIFLYSGLYHSHEISPAFPFKLESILLKNVSRRFVTNPRDPQLNEPYLIPGDFILIPAITILNLNVSYYKLIKNHQKIKRRINNIVHSKRRQKSKIAD